MFGLKLKLWMEAHLGRPRHKSASSTTTTAAAAAAGPTTKSQNKSKESSASTSANSHPTTAASSTNQPPPTPPPDHRPPPTPALNTPRVPRDPSPTHHQQHHHESSTSQQQQQQQQLPPAGSSSSSSTTSASILLATGSFTHNLSLSSPDTGYSTDGYSPKSVYPALSFESSGKSTPKSSYTISSLVSSELLHNSSISCASTKSFCTGPSKNSSVGTGLELEPDADAPDSRRPTADLEKSNFNGAHEETVGIPNPPSLPSIIQVRKDSSTFTTAFPNERTPPPPPPPPPAAVAPAEISHHNHRRTESMDSNQRSNNNGTNPHLLPSQFPAECYHLKHAFSLCSPRRAQRTKIKTNPWISFQEPQITRPGSHVTSAAQPARLDTSSTEMPGTKPEELPGNKATTVAETNLLYRIPASASSGASDSGKGSLEPGTNRNSTESSCLLLTDGSSSSTSSSARNSILAETQAGDSPTDGGPLQSADKRGSGHHADEISQISKVPAGPTVQTLPAQETDILSDWTQTTDEDPEDPVGDDDGDEEEDDDDGAETDQCVTPTPSSPDVTFNHSTSSCSSSKLGFSEPPWKSHFPPFRRAENMNVPTTAFPPGGIPWSQSASVSQFSAAPVALPRWTAPVWDDPTGSPESARAPKAKVEEPSGGGGGAQTMARGAFGFLKRMFRKSSAGGVSSPRTPRGKSRFFRAARSNSLTSSEKVDNVGTNTIIPGVLLSPETVVVSSGKALRKSALSAGVAGSFLTPTPNAFRRRQHRESESAAPAPLKGCAAKAQAIKTDIIRLPPPSASSSCSNQSRDGTGVEPTAAGAVTSRDCQQAPYYYNQTQAAAGGTGSAPGPGALDCDHSNSNTMSTSSSHSLSIMSTSTGAGSEAGGKPGIQPGLDSERTPKVNSHHHRESRRRRESPPKLKCAEMKTPNLSNCPVATAAAAAAAAAPVKYDSPRLSSRINNSPSFNNYSPIHRLVVTGGSQLLSRGGVPLVPPSPLLPSGQNNQHYHPHQHPHHHHHHLSLNQSPIPPPRTPNVQCGMNSAVASPGLHYRQPVVVTSGTCSPYSSSQAFMTCSPSPILRNPRYQYITSSNQNSPVLNIPKRLQNHNNNNNNNNVSNNNYNNNQSHSNQNVPVNVHLGVQGHFGPAGGPVFRSPILRNGTGGGGGGFVGGGPPGKSCTGNFYSPEFVSDGGGGGQCEMNRELESNSVGNSDELALHHRPPHSRSTNQASQIHGSHMMMKEDMMMRSLGQPVPPHYNLHHPHQLEHNLHHPHPHPSDHHSQHLHHHQHHHHHDAKRFENQYYSPPVRDPSRPYLIMDGKTDVMVGMRRSRAERIYESVDDSEEDDDEHEEDGMRSDEGDGEGGDFELQVRDGRHPDPRSASSQESGMMMNRRHHQPYQNHHPHHPHQHEQQQQQLQQQQHHYHHHEQEQPRLPPRSFPMTLGTYLSETETRLLEADRDTDRKYKRLISEAEALLKEISAVEKSQQPVAPWLSRHASESLRSDECPQSDPLRRKAYDCWALRRLQQELAGCSASPPLLHRSRLQITSPVTPGPNHNLFNIPPHHQQQQQQQRQSPHPEFPRVPSRRNSQGGNSSSGSGGNRMRPF